MRKLVILVKVFIFINNMKISKSWQSFFQFKPDKPLINSYGQFLQYANKNNITLNRNIRKYALKLYLNKQMLK